MPDPILPALFGFVDDAAKNHVRSTKRRRIKGEPGEDVPASSKANPDRRLVGAEGQSKLERDVRAIFAQMDADDAELLKLGYFDGLRAEDIAVLRGWRADRVRQRLVRARATFGKLYLAYLEAQGETP